MGLRVYFFCNLGITTGIYFGRWLVRNIKIFHFITLNMLHQHDIFSDAFLFTKGSVHQYFAICKHTTAICITRIVYQHQQIVIIHGIYCCITTISLILSFPWREWVDVNYSASSIYVSLNDIKNFSSLAVHCINIPRKPTYFSLLTQQSFFDPFFSNEGVGKGVVNVNISQFVSILCSMLVVRW